jgi:hypothetical protein
MEALLAAWIPLGIFFICFIHFGSITSYLGKIINLPLEFLSEKVRQLKLENDIKEHEINKSKNDPKQ